jgi:hypothetical protein
MKYCYLLVILFILSLPARSQKNYACKEKIDMAEEAFNDGNYAGCISILENTPGESGCRKIEAIRWFELLAKAYLEIDNIEKTDSMIYILLKNDPFFTLKEGMQQEDLNYMIEKTRKKQYHLFSVGFRAAMCFPFFKTTEIYKDLNSQSIVYPYYQTPYIRNNISWKYSFWLEYQFHKHFSINSGFGYSSISYIRDFLSTYAFGYHESIKYSETLKFIEVPAYVKFIYPVNKHVVSQAILGIGWCRILSAQATAYHSMTDTNGTINTISHDKDIEVMGMRNVNNFEWICGLGIGYKIKGWNFNIDLRYSGGLNSFTNKDKRLSNDTLITKYYYVDNSVRINMFEIGISVSYNLFSKFNADRRRNFRH